MFEQAIHQLLEALGFPFQVVAQFQQIGDLPDWSAVIPCSKGLASAQEPSHQIIAEIFPAL